MFRSPFTRCSAGWLAFVCMLLAPVLYRPGAVELQGQARTQPRERVLYVSVVDRATNAPVEKLGPSDLIVREDGAAREVLRVERATSPMPVALIVDNSQAAQPAIADLRRALATLVQGLDGIGPMAFVTVADRPTIVVDYTTSLKDMQEGVGSLFHAPQSGATLLDGITDVARGLRKRESDRAAIVVVTTENIEYSNLYYRQVLDTLRDSGAAMHAVVLVNPKGSLRNDEARNRAQVLDEGPRHSGGLRVDVLTSMAFEPKLKELAAILKHEYRVTYARPESLIPPEKTEVAAVKPGLEAYGRPARGQATK